MTSKKLAKRGAALAMAAVMMIGSATTAFAASRWEYKNGEMELNANYKSAAATADTTVEAAAGVWKQDAKGWWWQNADGSYPKNEWKWIDGNKDGVAECYYFDGNGYMLSNTTTPDGSTVNRDGQWTVYGGKVKKRDTKDKKKQASVKGWIDGANGQEYKNVTDQSKLVSYLSNVDDLSNVSIATPVGTGITFPEISLRVGEKLVWINQSGGTDYQLYYEGPVTDDLSKLEAAGYTYRAYPNAQSYPTFDSWTTPDGITVDYLRRVLDEHGRIMTATAEELGLSYEGGKVRDVAYDSNYPLKRVVDLYALNTENLGNDWYEHEKDHPALQERNSWLRLYEYHISKLSGQECSVDYYEDEIARYDAEVAVLKDWLNSFDFEHATEMERAEKVHDMLKKASYDFEVLENRGLHIGDALYNMLIRKKGVCQDWAVTARFLCALVGLKCDIMGSSQSDHMMYVMQVDGVPHGGDNTGLKLELDWREESRLGTRESFNYWFGEYIEY